MGAQNLELQTLLCSLISASAILPSAKVERGVELSSAWPKGASKARDQALFGIVQGGNAS